MTRKSILSAVALALAAAPAARADWPLAVNGQPRAVIVIADQPTPAADAAAKGALAVVAERPVSGVNAPVLMTHGTIEALGRLAAFHRSRTMARVVGVTGTAGKTTVKELLAGILSRPAGRTRTT